MITHGLVFPNNRDREWLLGETNISGGKDMTTLPQACLRWLVPVLAGILCYALLGPSLVNAQTTHAAGDSATIAYADGDEVRLRAAPGYDGEVLGLFPEGAGVEIVEGPISADDGSTWYGVMVENMTGYMVADYLYPDGTVSSGSSGAGSTGTAVTTSSLNMRTGPSTGDGIILIIPSGASVTLTGESANGFLSIEYDGWQGWAYGEFISSGDVAPEPDAAASGSAVTTSALNQRSDPDTSSTVILVMPAGAAVAITGTSQNGFFPVSYSGQSGWASGDYLSEGSDSGANPSPGGGSGIAWPVSGGTWEVIQGYNGGTHQNRSASAQYYYALDIASTDGNTAGQPVYAPASGTIQWVDPGSGGIAIDMGNGHVVAMFHCTFDAGLGRGQSVQQGQYLGTVSGPGGAGYASTPHVDITLWETSGGGRTAAPFSGGNAISGWSFEDVGGWNQHNGTQFNP